MAIYTVGRKRVIIGLLLTTVLLLTLDLRGNLVIDNLRDGFRRVMEPVEVATEVVTLPIERMWNGISNYEDLREENLALQEQVDRLIGTQAAAEAAVIEGQELQALYTLPSLSGIDTEVARVVGESANNLDQVIEINKGSTSGIETGMAVVNQAGLVGSVIQVSRNSSRVMLVTDDRYTVAVKVTSSGAVPVPGQAAEEGEALPPVAIVPGVTLPDGSPAPDTTLPAGSAAAEPVEGSTGSVPDGSVPDGSVPEDSVPDGSVLDGSVPDGSVPDGSVPDGSVLDGSALDDPAATAAPGQGEVATAVVDKEYGALEGRGGRRLPQVRFLQDVPSLLELQAGDLVETAGGSESLAPTGIPVGRVINRADRPGSGGPLLDVEVHADLARLNFVRVVLYKPLSEVER